ncbi:alkaline phosphatase D family protein [Lacibacter sp. MH-610]|uniref:alkaline phosphatase D family protein n=1 Tax=Lacibacter sp. MH-610 TaxID=3020883 RepID=UPI00389167BF
MRKYVWLLLVVFTQYSCKQEVTTTSIAFGSCGHEDEEQPVLSLAADYKPDAFVFLGDNIYGDTDNMDTMQHKYNKLGSKPEFQKIRAAAKLYAIWDDHDFGRNDAGKWYPFKKESKEIFLNFFNEPAASERRKHEGIYHTEYLTKNGKTIQLILLDVRTFRSDLLLFDKKNSELQQRYFYPLDYQPHASADSTLLGAEQWKWLEGELKKPADLRFICSGSQFAIEFNGYEAWANFPHEQKKMTDLIKNTKANGVVFLTGDVHYAEISKLQEPGLYPLYDITSSGITSTWSFATPNKNRIEGPVMDNHFGLITVEWKADPVIKMQIIDKNKNERIEYTLKKSDISF